MPGALYLDTSVILRAVLESGTSPDVEERLRDADSLITSRLSEVEAARAMIRLRSSSEVAEAHLADAERSIAAILGRCEMWELTRAVCEMARHVAPGKPLRTLDALHLATFVLARRRIAGLELLTVDQRLLTATGDA